MKNAECSCKVTKERKGKKNAAKNKIPPPKIVPQIDFLDQFHETKICSIPATSPPKQNAFDMLRPPPRTVLDYKISQMDTKLEREVKDGVQKFHIQNTTAIYIPYPPGVDPPPEIPEQVFVQSYGSGGPPLCKYLDEIWEEKIEKRQEKYKKHLVIFIEERKLRDKAERKAKRLRRLRRLERIRKLLEED